MSFQRIIYSIIVCTALLATTLPAQPYDYPIKPGTPEWNALTSMEQRTQACQIPESILKTMSTSDLLETCLNYPAFFKITAYNNLQFGFEQITKEFNGLQELLKRADIGKECIRRYVAMKPDSMVKLESASFDYFNFEILIAQDTIINNLSKAERKILLKEAYQKYKGKTTHQDYGAIGYTNNVYLLGKILQKEKHGPFMQALNSKKGMRAIVNGNGMYQISDAHEIMYYVELFLNKK